MTPPIVRRSPEVSSTLDALLRELPPEHRAIIECLDADRAAQVAASERRAEGLQRLQEACVALLRNLDPQAIGIELASHAARLADSSGAVAVFGAETGDQSATHVVAGTIAKLPVPPAVAAAIADAVRTGRPVRPGAHGDVLALPLRSSHRAEGALAVYDIRDPDIEELISLLATLAATAVAALTTVTALAENVRDRRQSEALAELARALGSTQRLGEVFHLGLRHSTGILGAEGAAIALARGEYLHIVAAAGVAAPTQGVYVPITESAIGRAMAAGRTLIVNEITAEMKVNLRIRQLSRAEKFVSVPLRTPEGPIGALAVANRGKDFTDDDARVLERLASQLAVAVVKVRLFEEAAEATRDLRSAFDAIAGGMVVVDAEGFILRHNARLLAIAGVDPNASLIGRSLYEVITGTPATPSDDDPIGAAINRRAVGRGTMRPREGDRVYEVVASPHPQGGAVVTVDDVTTFLTLTERYRLVVESTTDGIVITDATGTITFANDATKALLGRDVAAAGLRLADLASAESREAFDRAASMARAGEAAHADGEVVRPDGERRVVSVSVAPIRGAGLMAGVVASLRDATAEARARAAVAAADSRYRNLFEAAADGIFTIDADGVMTSANRACELICGSRRDAIVGRRLTSLVDPSEAGAVTASIALAATGRPTAFECSVPRADGSSRLMEISFSPLGRAGGEVNTLLAIARDVTELRAQAVALERAESRYARLFESAHDGICTVDEEGWITSANRSFRRIVGRPRRRNDRVHVADLVPATHQAAIWDALTATLEGSRERAEFRVPVPDGREVVVSVSTAPLFEHDRVHGALAIVRDMTEERALLDHAARRDKLAALGEMVGGVAHEVNSPLTGILAHAQLLQGDVPPDSDARRAADTIVAEARRAARIVGKLLTFARQNAAERVATDINQVLEDTLELRRYPLRMQDVSLDVQLDRDLPAIQADPFQLQQVFINLLSNAEQAVVSHGGGERRITVRTERRQQEIVVAITDTGAGISPEHLPNIFNPFFTTKPRGVGTGLGLSISFGIVREHGGNIHAASPPGQGATFTVHLPIRDPRTPAPGR